MLSDGDTTIETSFAVTLENDSVDTERMVELTAIADAIGKLELSSDLCVFARATAHTTIAANISSPQTPPIKSCRRFL